MFMPQFYAFLFFCLFFFNDVVWTTVLTWIELDISMDTLLVAKNGNAIGLSPSVVGFLLFVLIGHEDHAGSARWVFTEQCMLWERSF